MHHVICHLLSLLIASLNPVADDTDIGSGSQGVLVIEDVQTILIRDVRVPVVVPGQIEQFTVEVGEKVVRGASIAKLNSFLADRAVALAEHELGIAKIESNSDSRLRLAQQKNDLAEKRFQRLIELRRQSPASISLDEVQDATLNRREASSALELAQQEREIAELTMRIKAETLSVNQERLAQHAVKAPFDGMVVEIIGSQGEWLAEGAPVVRMVDLSRLRLEAFVDGDLFDSTLTGKSVRFQTSIPGRVDPVEFLGKIVFASPIVQPVNGQIRIWADVDNPDYVLRPGVLGTLTINLTDSAGAMPASSVRGNAMPASSVLK